MSLIDIAYYTYILVYIKSGLQNRDCSNIIRKSVCTQPLIFGSDANSIRNLCGPAGVRVYVCMYVWVHLSLKHRTGTKENRY